MTDVDIVAVARYLHGRNKTGTLKQKQTWFSLQRKRHDDPVIGDPIDIVYAVLEAIDTLGYGIVRKVALEEVAS